MQWAPISFVGATCLFAFSNVRYLMAYIIQPAYWIELDLQEKQNFCVGHTSTHKGLRTTSYKTFHF